MTEARASEKLGLSLADVISLTTMLCCVVLCRVDVDVDSFRDGGAAVAREVVVMDAESLGRRYDRNQGWGT